jgi:hypothetical protein
LTKFFDYFEFAWDIGASFFRLCCFTAPCCGIGCAPFPQYFTTFAVHHAMYVALTNENELAVFPYLLGVAAAATINNGF